MRRAEFKHSFPCVSFDGGDVWAFGGGCVQRTKFLQSHAFPRLGLRSFFPVHHVYSTWPLRTLSGCVLLYCSLAWRLSRLCQPLLLHVCCVCLSFWDEVCFSSSDRLARQTRLPFLFCFVFMSMAIFSPLKTILRLGRL